mmetsp:Transcript_15056/g.32411  ORF Transcript_15056/g.32411 Transcript_15056/m.32411 type:complete len:98 (-) Transcript_15056:19-312(-)
MLTVLETSGEARANVGRRDRDDKEETKQSVRVGDLVGPLRFECRQQRDLRKDPLGWSWATILKDPATGNFDQQGNKCKELMGSSFAQLQLLNKGWRC